MICLKNVRSKKLMTGILILSMTISCLLILTSAGLAGEEEIALTVTGTGVEKTVAFTLAELEALPQAVYTYSGYNHWPSLQIFKDMQGPTLKTILDRAGLKADAALIRVKLNDAVYSEFTKAQLLDEPRWYFPDGEQESNLGVWPPVRGEKGKIPVETIIALNQQHGKLIYGQCAVNEPTCCINQMLSGLCQGGVIEVLAGPLQQWEAPQPDVAPGTVAAGTKVTIKHKDGTPYHALVYYTLDGSPPSYGSSIANISYPNFQPEFNRPITIDRSVTIMTRTIGMGRLDSQVATYQYTVTNTQLSSEDSGTPAAFGAVRPPVPVGRQFSDLEGHWASDDVYALVAKGIIDGVSADQFKPEDNVTRAQIAKILTTALHIAPAEGDGISFTDVAAESWYYASVRAAVQNGLMTGYDENTFGPDQYMNREQLAAVISRALKRNTSETLSAESVAQIINGFTDKEQISTWAYEDIARVVNCGIATGTSDNDFAPRTSATRAQASVMILRLCNKLNL